MGKHHLLGICGALRKGSTNRLLLAEAVRMFDPDRYVEGSIRLPVFDEDIETGPGIPEAVVIAAPEYNKSIPGGLKNALDWVSRVKGAVWRDKPVAIISAADGRAGGDRSQFALRLAMVPFRARVLPGPEVMVANSRGAFDDQGRMKDARYDKALTELMGLLHDEVRRSEP